MSINFYFRNERLYKECKEFCEKHDIDISIPEIHIAKVSAGWKPLFQHNLLFASVSEIKEFHDKSGLQIFDEYNNKYNWEEFTDRVLNVGKSGKSHQQYSYGRLHIDNEGYEFLEGEWS